MLFCVAILLFCIYVMIKLYNRFYSDNFIFYCICIVSGTAGTTGIAIDSALGSLSEKVQIKKYVDEESTNIGIIISIVYWNNTFPYFFLPFLYRYLYLYLVF